MTGDFGFEIALYIDLEDLDGLGFLRASKALLILLDLDEPACPRVVTIVARWVKS